MPFISDDYEWRYVGVGEKYDKNRFVIVRKLFIASEPKLLFRPTFNETIVRNTFQAYGDIESIQMLNHRKKEAYVTFTSDQHAYAAVSANDELIRRGKRLFIVQPADTWVQPSTLGEFGSNEIDPPLIYKLNDDCLTKILGYLNVRSLLNTAEVSQRFAELAQPFFKRYNTFNAHNFKSNQPLYLSDFRLHLKYLGEHLKILHVHWDMTYNRRQLDRMIFKMRQYLNTEHLRELYFRDILLNERHFEILKPLRKNLDHFGIRIHSLSFDYITPDDWKDVPVYKNETNSLWSKVQDFLRNRINNDYFEFCVRKCAPFDGLTFSADFPHRQIPQVVRIEPEVKRLTIISKHPECMTRISLHPLRKLESLDTLILLHIDKRTVLEVFQFLPEIPSLKNLTVQTHGGYDGVEIHRVAMFVGAALVPLATKLPHLESLITQYIPINKISIIAFVGLAKQLKILHLHRGQADFDDKFVDQLGFARQHANEETKLNLFLDEFIIHHRLSYENRENYEKNILLSHQCKCDEKIDF